MSFLILLAALTLQDNPFPDGDPKPAIEAAKKKAAAENRRVLVLVGDNNSEPSRAAAAMFKKDKAVAKLILYEYDVVYRGVHELSKSIGDSLPYLVIMDADGKELSGASAPADSKAMVELLKKHQATPWVAKDVLAKAMKRAAEEKKRVLLTFGAPW